MSLLFRRLEDEGRAGSCAEAPCEAVPHPASWLQPCARTGRTGGASLGLPPTVPSLPSGRWRALGSHRPRERPAQPPRGRLGDAVNVALTGRQGGGGQGAYSSAVDCGMRSGILVSFRLEHSTTPASQRHLGGHTTSLLHSLLSW